MPDLSFHTNHENTISVVDSTFSQLELTGDKALDILRHIFKYENFRGRQEEAIRCVMDKQNTLLVMLTGGGKTVCYVVPALMENKVSVVVFPLLALLLDQAERMRSHGLNVCYLMTNMEEDERMNVMHQLNADPPEHNFFFVTPESVLTPAVLYLLQDLSSKNKLGLIVIDEAHCIDTWGFHFRSCYAELWKLTNLGSPVLAMTGTATQRTQSVILNSLQLTDKAVTIKQTSNRINLIYHVAEKKSNGIDAIVAIIKQEFSGQCGIVYCLQRKDTSDVVYDLKRAGVSAVCYHAGMDVHSKQTSVASWKVGEAHVMCATVAFGMGIDKSNVRFVEHHSMPKDLESYVQESGRAGRDGGIAHCYIFFRFEDRTKHLRNISCLPDSDRKNIALDSLNDMVKYCIAPICRKKQIVTYFDNEENHEDICNKSCDVCMSSKTMQPINRSDSAKELVCCLEEMQKIQAKVM